MVRGSGDAFCRYELRIQSGGVPLPERQASPLTIPVLRVAGQKSWGVRAGQGMQPFPKDLRLCSERVVYCSVVTRQQCFATEPA
jgi:hypothetical protein